MMHISTNIANIETGPSNIETSPSKAINGRSTTNKADRTSEKRPRPTPLSREYLGIETVPSLVPSTPAAWAGSLLEKNLA